MKFKYPSPPMAIVTSRIILCSAMPRSMTGDASSNVLMPSYISASISQNALVLSPTMLWSCDSAYPMHFSVYRRLHSVAMISCMLQSSSRKPSSRDALSNRTQTSGMAMASLASKPMPPSRTGRHSVGIPETSSAITSMPGYASCSMSLAIIK